MRTALPATIAIAVLMAACAGTSADRASTSIPADTSSVRDQPPSTNSAVDSVVPSELQTVTASWATDFGTTSIPLDELHVGIPASDPRDRIPPIDRPAFETIEAADGWIGDNEPGVLLIVAETARFYPLSILTRHEIVNDRIGDTPVVVTYCPLCNTAVVFDPTVGGEVLRFGVSGLLRQSDLVMWDRQTESLWQQITGEAIVGELTGARLAPVPTSIVAWSDFTEAHPDGEVLAFDQGFGIEYGINPYTGYSSSQGPISSFFDETPDDRFPALSRVVGVTIGVETAAYPFETIEREGAVNDVVGDTAVTVWWGAPNTADALDTTVIASGRAIGTGVAYLATVGELTLEFEAIGDDRFRDVETGSVWTLLGSAVEGSLAGSRLEPAPHRNEFWFAFAAFFPDSRVWQP
jgi:hypothetical protein